MKHYKKVVLVVLDGFGLASPGRGNAISLVPTPNLDNLVANFPCLTLQASGPLVGLPWGEMGNSEVGHLNLGAGRIVGQDLPRITNAIQNGSFFKNPEFSEAIEHAKKNNTALHLVGMVSQGGVHSLDEHLYALLAIAAEQNLAKVFIHMFTDGRDTAEKVALESIKKLEEKISEIGVGKIASVTGRFYAMDRGGHWGQTLQTYQALVLGKGLTALSATECVMKNYQNQIFDEMIQPTVIVDEQNNPVGRISDNDSVILFNFRPDRVIQLSVMFANPELVPQDIKYEPVRGLYFVTMTEYKNNINVHVAFPRVKLDNNLSEIISQNGLKQFHTAESEKYTHVTSFFNGGRSAAYKDEEWLIVKSPNNNARNYVDEPQMSAGMLTDILIKEITKTDKNFFLANFANGDMVGHTGNLEAAKKAVQVLDDCVGKLAQTALLTDAALLITADHGNIEQMINLKTGEIDKDHTTNPVPFLLVINELKFKVKADRKFLSLSSQVPAGVLSDIAPTILELFALPKPAEMTGISLLSQI